MMSPRSLVLLISGTLVATAAAGPTFAGKGETAKSGVTEVPGDASGELPNPSFDGLEKAMMEANEHHPDFLSVVELNGLANGTEGGELIL